MNLSTLRAVHAQTKSEALSGLIRSLREEADLIETGPFKLQHNVLARAKTIEAEIIFLEFIQKEWKEKANREYGPLEGQHRGGPETTGEESQESRST